MTFAAIVVFGYLMGSCPWGYWLVRVFHRADIRKLGSGSIGASNVWRAYGPRLGVTVVLLDVLKGFAPALIGVLAVSHLCGILAGAAAMAGHARPLFLRFEKGGKMVATGGGVVIAIAPLVALPLALLWILTFAVFRYPSVASIVAALVMPFLAVAIGYPDVVVAFCVVAAGAIVFLHRTNLRRLRAGTEHRVRFRGAARLT